MLRNRILNLIILFVLIAANAFQNVVLIPVTFLLDDVSHVEHLRHTRAFSSFVYTMSSDNSSLRGVYVADKLQLPITYQPTSDPGFVTTAPDAVTLFSTAANYGSIGLIAHNHLAGNEFFRIDEYDNIFLVYGDGEINKYIVTEIREYRAISPNSPYSSFVNLADPETTISYRDLFFDTYGVSDRLVLQTCISKDNYDSWGRLFIIATPVN